MLVDIVLAAMAYNPAIPFEAGDYLAPIRLDQGYVSDAQIFTHFSS
jgi:hypothetical protein